MTIIGRKAGSNLPILVVTKHPSLAALLEDELALALDTHISLLIFCPRPVVSQRPQSSCGTSHPAAQRGAKIAKGDLRRSNAE